MLIMLEGRVRFVFGMGVSPLVLSIEKHLDSGRILSIGVTSFTHLTPLIAPPLSAQTLVPFALKATEFGNSPPLPTGKPRGVSWIGFVALMLKAEIVCEPG